MWSTTRFVEYSKPPSADRSRRSASWSRSSAWSAWVAMITASNRSRAPSAVRTVTPAASRATSVTADPARTEPGRQGGHDPIDVAHRAARDRPPLERIAVADQAVVVEEAQEVVDREVEDPLGAGGPDGGRDRDEEVVAEARPVAAVVEEVAERRRGRRRLVEGPPGVAVEAQDVGHHPPVTGPGDRRRAWPGSRGRRAS